MATLYITKKSKKKLESKTISLKDFNEFTNSDFKTASDGEDETNKDRRKFSEPLSEIKFEDRFQQENGEKTELDEKKDKKEQKIVIEEKKDEKKGEKKEDKKEIEKKEEKKDIKPEKKEDKKDIKKEDNKKKNTKKEEKKTTAKNEKKTKKKDDKKAGKKDSQGEVIVLTDIEVLAEELPQEIDSQDGEKTRQDKELVSSSEDNEDRISLVVTEVEESDKPKKGFNILKRIKNLKVAKQEQKKAAIKIQAAWRGYSFRKKLNSAGNFFYKLKNIHKT